MPYRVLLLALLGRLARKNLVSCPCKPRFPLATLHGDSFQNTQKSTIHFARDRGKEGAKDGQESTLYKGYIVWHRKYLTEEEYEAEEAKNEAIWDSLMAGSSSTTQSAEPETTEDWWSADPVDLGASFHDVSIQKTPTTASLPASSSHSKKTKDQKDAEYMAVRAVKVMTNYGENGKSHSNSQMRKTGNTKIEL